MSEHSANTLEAVLEGKSGFSGVARTRPLPVKSVTALGYELMLKNNSI